MFKRYQQLAGCDRSAFFVISFVAIMFGYWFAKMQVNVVASHSLSTYPLSYFLLTVSKCYFTILAFFVFSQFIASHLSSHPLPAIRLAYSYAPLLLVYFHCPMYWIASLVVVAQFVCLLKALNQNDYQRIASRYGVDILVFLVFLLLHTFMTTRFSPLHWKDAMLVSGGFNGEEVPVLVPVFRGFLLAKQFAFSTVDHSQWAGIMHPPVSLISPLMQLIAFIFDIPSVSYQAFHVLVSVLYFILMVTGSFGFYLFLKYAARVNALFAFFGGYIFLFSGAPLLSQSFISDDGIFLSPQVALPYALLAISCAYEKNKASYACWAGLAMAAQFFIYAPHPEGTLYSLFFYSIFVFGLFIFSKQLSWKRRFYLGATSIVMFFLLSGFTLAPLMIDKLTGNMYVYAHTGDIGETYYRYYALYARLLFIFGPLGLLLLTFYKKATPTFLSALLLAFSILGCVHIIINADYVAKVVSIFHLGLHIWVPPRIGVYFYTAVFIVLVYGLDILARALFDLVKQKYAYALGAHSHE